MIVAAFLMCDGREFTRQKGQNERRHDHLSSCIDSNDQKKKKEKIQKNGGGGGGGATPSSLVARAVSLIYDIIAGTLCLCFPEEYLSQ